MIIRTVTLLILSFASLHAHGIIPAPTSYEAHDGECVLPLQGSVQAPTNEVKSLLALVNKASGTNFRESTDGADHAIQFLSGDMRKSKPVDKSAMGEGAYEMLVGASGVKIYADTASGRFYALQSLIQLLQGAKKTEKGITLARAMIMDSPRFAWRGFMLDESRHFSGIEVVKKWLDAMAYYKLNRFHWHLTDSPGWRIEIKKYPKLTTVGAIGNETDPNAPAQFYTQEQVKEVVAYAKERHIVVIPEIDMPGHANAAVRAYPEHSGGKSEKHGEFTFHPANPATDAFLTDILREVAALFPDAGIIHYGGDEVHFGWDKWPTLPAVKKLMNEQNMKLKDVEKAFNQRFAKTINSMGYKTGGWDEISHAGLDPAQTVVFWWRHNKLNELHYSLKNGYEVVLCPRRPCYFDFVQHDSHKVGRRWGGFVPIEDTYGFPDALELPESYTGTILGIQACLWTEQTETQARRDFMTFPRLIALAEAAWTPKEQKDFSSFENRLKAHLPQLKARGIGYYDPFANSPEVKK